MALRASMALDTSDSGTGAGGGRFWPLLNCACGCIRAAATYQGSYSNATEGGEPGGRGTVRKWRKERLGRHLSRDRKRVNCSSKEAAAPQSPSAAVNLVLCALPSSESGPAAAGAAFVGCRMVASYLTCRWALSQWAGLRSSMMRRPEGLPRDPSAISDARNFFLRRRVGRSPWGATLEGQSWLMKMSWRRPLRHLIRNSDPDLWW
mmetsp:Transcript_32354/g.64072  ORF Transcript_32354/g.64072 Transcript_32354/m.64072 type:complete len:206 (-) Transcript_32354:105-722(-)